MRIKDKIRDKLNQFSLKTQLTSLIIFTVSGIIIIIIMFNYERNIRTIMVQQISVSSSLLNLETQNLDSYMSEINRYSLFLRNNAEILQSLTKDRALNYSEVTNIQNQIKSNFYSRNDLLSYQLYLLNQSEDYEITSERQKIKVSYGDTIKSLPEYKAFTIGKYYKYVQATKETNSFFIFYRTIINIEDRKPIAVVKLTLDTSFADSLAENHNDTGELFCVMNKEGQLFYSNHDEMTSVQDSIRIKDELIKERDNNFITQINGQKYLAIYNTSKLHDYYIVILKPLELIDYQVNNTRNMSLVLGLLSISLAASLAFFFVELVTKPLSKLSHRLRKVGKGNFTTTAKIGGSREIVQLADSFNQMIYQIDELIKKNYLSELNEKTARLIALEAQINPHFLYNTLQAISAEAIVNDQLQINSMVTSLASMLRYSIKGGDLVRLKDEMKHVQDYLLLQHARFGESLTYGISIDPDTEDILIPKISIQILVENSITHGMKGFRNSIHIQINCTLTDNVLTISVADNGEGMEKEQLNQLYDSFTRAVSEKGSETGIGLYNIYSRLKLLYGDSADITIRSILNVKTTVCLTISQPFD